MSMARAMQPPTCSGVRVRSTADCDVVFHAVALGMLPLISRRLTIEERRAIQSGHVFVWEERTPTIETVGDGLERWTDSRRWGASRLAKDFLLYQEKLPDVSDPHVRAAMHHNRLVKQTYSVHVDRPDGRRKWHLVAYSSPETGHHLATVDDIPELSALRYQIPEGCYQAARYSKTRTRQEAPDEQSTQPAGSVSMIEFSGSVSALDSSGSSSPELVPPLPSYSRARHVARDLHPAKITHIRHIVESEFPSCPPPPIPSRPDPEWVLKNGVPVRPMPNTYFGADSAKNMAPLVYVRHSPYHRRHPLDNDALRALDAMR